MRNLYFEVYTEKVPLDYIQTHTEKDLWYEIANSPEYQTNEMLDKFHESPYNFIYNQNIKDKLLEIYPEFKNLTKVNLDDPNICIKMIPQIEYRQHDEQFDNEMTFLEYFNSERISVDKKTNITKEILIDAGFEEITQDFMKKYHHDEFNQEDYCELRLWTESKDDYKNCLKLDIDNGPNNRGTKWHLHIDNNTCCTVGSGDISTVWEFNTLMEVFGSKFRIIV